MKKIICLVLCIVAWSACGVTGLVADEVWLSRSKSQSTGSTTSGATRTETKTETRNGLTIRTETTYVNGQVVSQVIITTDRSGNTTVRVVR